MPKLGVRARFVCPAWPRLRERHYDTQADAIRDLNTNAKTLAKVERQVPVTRATLLRLLRAYRDRKDPTLEINDYITESRNG